MPVEARVRRADRLESIGTNGENVQIVGGNRPVAPCVLSSEQDVVVTPCVPRAQLARPIHCDSLIDHICSEAGPEQTREGTNGTNLPVRGSSRPDVQSRDAGGSSLGT